METALTLEEALRETRNQMGGITLDLTARIIKNVFDEAEVRVLVGELQRDTEPLFMDDNSDEVAEKEINREWSNLQEQINR